MPFSKLLVALVLIAAPVGAKAQENPVVLELFTSQGCSSCPPADALLAELSGREGVIALALHVDYWDYLGWADSFGKPAYSKRQRAYAKAMRKRSVFTPQMIVQGQDRLIGHDVVNILGSIEAHRSKPMPVGLEVERADGGLTIRLEPLSPAVGPAEVHLVTLIPEHSVLIEAGENAGQEIGYTDIVTDWRTVAEWDGREAAELRVEGVAPGPLAVIVQRQRLGAIVAATELP